MAYIYGGTTYSNFAGAVAAAEANPGQGAITVAPSETVASPTPVSEPVSSGGQTLVYGGTLDSQGNWITQPRIIYNGQTLTFDTPQEYINKLNELASTIQGGIPSDLMTHFTNLQTQYQDIQTTNVNAQYQKYFGRDANSAEMTEWIDKNINTLITQLNNDYKAASGINYDGSPIQEGQQQTVNQISSGSITQQATLYGPNGQSEVVDVGSTRASELQSEGWGLTEGSYVAPDTTTEPPPDTTQEPNAKKVRDLGGQEHIVPLDFQTPEGWSDLQVSMYSEKTPIAPDLATLYGPDGEARVVAVGSGYASNLQSQGWGLTEGSYVEPMPDDKSIDPPSRDFLIGQPPEGANLISDPADLIGLREDQLWRDPNSDDIYVLSGETPTTPSDAEAEPDPQAAYAVDSLYQKYFGRPASATEQAYWSTQPLDELNTFLNAEYSKPISDGGSGHAYDGSPIKEDGTLTVNDVNYDEDTATAIAKIDQAVKDGIIPYDVGELYKFTVENYPKGVGFDTTTLLETFKNIKEQTIDPHFKDVIDLATADVENTIEYLEAKQAVDIEGETIANKQRLETATTNLEASGMTFTGEAIKQVGTKSAYETEKEGAVEAINRLVTTSGEAQRKAASQQLGLTTEQKLGSAATSKLGIGGYNILGGISGTIVDARESAYGGTLQQLINQQQVKNQLNTNLQFNL